MTRFKIVRNNTEEKKQLLQAKLSTSLVQDINLMCEWSGNEKSYVVGELLRYALSMETDFQTYKKSIEQKGFAGATAGVSGNRKEPASEKISGVAVPVAGV